MRTCPAAAAEHCAISLRHLSSHYGPVINRQTVVFPACEQTFQQVRELINRNRELYCPQLLLPENAPTTEEDAPVVSS